MPLWEGEVWDCPCGTANAFFRTRCRLCRRDRDGSEPKRRKGIFEILAREASVADGNTRTTNGEAEATMDGFDIAREHHLERALPWIVRGVWYRGLVIAQEHEGGRVCVYAPLVGFRRPDALAVAPTESAAERWIDSVCGQLREDEKAGV